MKTVGIIFSLCLLAVVPTLAAAQSGMIELPSIRPSEVYVTNSSSNTTVNFSINGNTCSPPLSTSLNPDHYTTFNCGGASHFVMVISTKTSSGAVQTRTRNLRTSGRYEIFSDPAGIWDVREMSSR